MIRYINFWMFIVLEQWKAALIMIFFPKSFFFLKWRELRYINSWMFIFLLMNYINFLMCIFLERWGVCQSTGPTGGGRDLRPACPWHPAPSLRGDLPEHPTRGVGKVHPQALQANILFQQCDPGTHLCSAPSPRQKETGRSCDLKARVMWHST